VIRPPLAYQEIVLNSIKSIFFNFADAVPADF